MPKFYQIKITNMWHKINKLAAKGLKTGQISLLLGIHRDTVRKYKRMSESEMRHLVERPYQNRQKKLADYTGYVRDLLKDAPYLTAPQVLDHLKETYSDLPEVSDKTVYNFVMAVREAFCLPKGKEEVRQMAKLPDPDYGMEAQVDWGEKNMLTTTGRWKKVYFFVMVMSRSRKKFVYFQDIPFTSRMTAYAHHLAFEYFGGVPRTILYDQDAVLIVSENLGEYQMTSEMDAFCKSAGYTPIFCRPADPQSKGKVENVVKYVKNNFIKGRIYSTIENLNKDLIDWLDRTGNGHRHATTRLVPDEEFCREQPHLLPYTMHIEKPQGQGRLYSVRRDNTISYKGSLYSLPLGTYEGDDTKVLLTEPTDKEIEIYSATTGEFIISYQVSIIKGKHITKPELARTSRADPSEAEKALKKVFDTPSSKEQMCSYLSMIKEKQPRYYNASVKVLLRIFDQLPKSMAGTILHQIHTNNVTNAYDVAEIANALLVRNGYTPMNDSPCRYGSRGRKPVTANLTPDRTNLKDYDKLIDEIS